MDRRVRKTIERVESELARPVDIGELASRAGISRSRLEHLFKRDVGMPIREFVMQRRLAHAAELLATTERRISELHRLAGFTDHANFDHAFKRRFGVSPRQYRDALST